ncbi:hypothetical protein WMY93_009406 [Mugilogobius chulae]|uniref:XK-related protein n=1 Tax=Mugilogobius chulae TaxID=88201 RepID=A0AAW0PBG2_9GOBI
MEVPVQERDISEIDPQECVRLEENDRELSRVHPPFSVVLTTVLYCAEFISAAIVCSMYHKSADNTWMGFTLTFMLVPAVIIQLTLIFIHRDLGRDRPLVLFLHLLLLGPVIRCVEALVMYFKAGKEEEPYVTIQEVPLMIIALISITYGALVCNILAIQIRYDDFKVACVQRPTSA